MGNGQHLIKNGGFSSYYYVSRGEISFDGLTAKVITWYNTKDNHEGLPRFSNTSKLYVKLDRYGNIVQLRVFKNRKATIDFDWGHKHGNHPKGTVHVHILNQNGKLHDDPNAVKFMSNADIRMYGKFIKHLNPDAKLRPSGKKKK